MDTPNPGVGEELVNNMSSRLATHLPAGEWLLFRGAALVGRYAARLRRHITMLSTASPPQKKASGLALGRQRRACGLKQYAQNRSMLCL